MLKAAAGNGSSFRLGITNNDISINDYRVLCFPCQARFVRHTSGILTSEDVVFCHRQAGLQHSSGARYRCRHAEPGPIGGIRRSNWRWKSTKTARRRPGRLKAGRLCSSRNATSPRADFEGAFDETLEWSGSEQPLYKLPGAEYILSDWSLDGTFLNFSSTQPGESVL